MARAYVKSCKHFNVRRCAEMCFNKKILSNITRIMRVSTSDYIS